MASITFNPVSDFLGNLGVWDQVAKRIQGKKISLGAGTARFMYVVRIDTKYNIVQYVAAYSYYVGIY